MLRRYLTISQCGNRTCTCSASASSTGLKISRAVSRGVMANGSALEIPDSSSSQVCSRGLQPAFVRFSTERGLKPATTYLNSQLFLLAGPRICGPLYICADRQPPVRGNGLSPPAVCFNLLNLTSCPKRADHGHITGGKVMATVKRRLPERPHLDVPKREARELLETCLKGYPEALERIRRRHPRFKDASDDAAITGHLKLSDAQLVIAREYGF